MLSFSSCSLCTRGPDSCGGDERPSEAVWQCPWCSSLFCQRINVMVHSFTGLLVLRQLPDAGECVSVHFADKEAVNVWFAAGCSISARSALQKKKELEAICAIWSFPSPAPDCVVTVLGPNNQKAGSASNNLFCSPLPLPFLICFQELPLESG